MSLLPSLTSIETLKAATEMIVAELQAATARADATEMRTAQVKKLITKWCSEEYRRSRGWNVDVAIDDCVHELTQALEQTS